MEFKPYEPSLRPYCAESFWSNVPQFFRDFEFKDYEVFLDKEATSGNYWCLFDNEKFIGCGGVAVEAGGVGKLCYGMISNQYHKQGYGRHLLNFRLAKLASDASLRLIRLDTTQFNPGFFSRFGFAEVKVKTDGYDKGLHRHDMELILTEENRRRLLK